MDTGNGTLYQLVRGFQKALSEANAAIPISITREEISVGDRMKELFVQLKEAKDLAFEDLFAERKSKMFIIATFVALLELAQLKKLQMFQREGGTSFFLKLADGVTDTELVESQFDLEMNQVNNDEGVTT